MILSSVIHLSITDVILASIVSSNWRQLLSSRSILGQAGSVLPSENIPCSLILFKSYAQI